MEPGELRWFGSPLDSQLRLVSHSLAQTGSPTDSTALPTLTWLTASMTLLAKLLVVSSRRHRPLIDKEKPR